jgi:hypothetical protein
VPAEQRLLRAQRSTTTTFNALQCAPESEHAQLAHRTIYRPPDSPDAPQVRAPTVEPQRLAHVAGAPDCPVRHATAVSQRPFLVVGAINTPHPTFNGIQVSNLQHITRAIAFNSRHSKEIKFSPKSGINPNQIVTRESDFCVHLSSCAWVASFLSHSFL